MPRNVIGLGLVVLLSIAIPIGIAGRLVYVAFAGRILGQPSSDQMYYHGTLLNGEVWHEFFRSIPEAVPPLHYECRIKRLNLTTGIDIDTGIGIVGESLYSIRLNDELYWGGINGIYKLADNKLERLAPMPQDSSTFDSMPFVFHDQITTIVEISDGGFRMVHLNGDHWVDGRKILLPGLGRVSYNDPQRQRKAFLPIACEQPLVKPSAGIRMSVVFFADEFHLCLSSIDRFVAYRKGFEYADDKLGVCSALAPENFSEEVSGWEIIEVLGNRARYTWMVCDRHGPLLTNFARPRRCFRRDSHGNWENLVGFDNSARFLPFIIAHPSESESFLMMENQTWGSAAIHRIDGNRIHPAHLILRGCMPEYLARWKKLGVGLLLAWLCHLGILYGGTAWMVRKNSPKEYEFGVERVTLAGPMRRAFALMIDLSIMVMILLLLTCIQLRCLAIEWTPWTERQVCDSLLESEKLLNEIMTTGSTLASLGNDSSLKTLYRSLLQFQFFLVMCFVEAIFLIGLKLCLEVWCGSTPGKWFCGIRTVRSTLRRPGFANLLVRDLLYWIDFPFFVTPLPAAISMAMSPHRQRLGDRLADTIVVCRDV